MHGLRRRNIDILYYMAKRIVTKIGDVFCVEVDNAYKRYFQYFCNDISQLNSSVIRVFKKRYPMDYKPKLEEIVQDEVDFYAHTILRSGIENGSWYKVGKALEDFNEEINKPLFGYIDDFDLDDDAEDNSVYNWYIWKINQPEETMESLPEEYRDAVEDGSIVPYIEILNRIKYGYYRYTSLENNTLKRHPHPYTDTYVKRDTGNTTLYLHFKGEDVVQKIDVYSNGKVNTVEGLSLQLPKFWETNWKYDEFITQEDFDDMWEKYTSTKSVIWQRE